MTIQDKHCEIIALADLIGDHALDLILDEEHIDENSSAIDDIVKWANRISDLGKEARLSSVQMETRLKKYRNAIEDLGFERKRR